MSTFEELIHQSSIVRRAYEFAKKAHRGQIRKNGEPYFNHSVAAARYVNDWGLDESTVAAALLHDVVEDTKYTLDDIKNKFGEEIAFLVDGVTKVGRVRYRGVESKVENLCKFILYLSQDIRVLLVRLADRLHNMKTLYALPPTKQKRIALETMEIYAPLAYRLGMQKLSGELEDLAFPYLYPSEYKWLIANVKERYEEREKYAQKLIPILKQELENNGIGIVNIDSRAKRYTSLYKKLLRYDMNLENIYDLVAIRVIVNTVEDCYAVLGLVHKMWPPVPNRFKDYIALPKPNGYKSLHTTVFGPDKKIVEIQIRTLQMHNEAELGIAAHFAYQQLRGTKSYAERKAVFANVKELEWVRQLRAWQKEFKSSKEDFLDSLKIDFFKDRILALTPKGEVIDLPAGSTVVDFAYKIHSEIGDSCSGAKVNGKFSPLNRKLVSGDVVEILTQKGKKPSESWLDFVVTSTARHHIKAALKKTRESLIIKSPTKTEFKIVVEDRVGLLKDIAAVFSRSRINIISMQAQQNARYPFLKIYTDALSKEKADKLFIKIKKIKEVKEVSYSFI